MDTLTVAQRSARMALVRGKNTKPELALRRALTAAGLLGYRIHHKTLLGRPDVTYTRWRVAVFVDGAWWHGRPDRFSPDRVSGFWRSKIEGNRARDHMVNLELAASGWVVVRVWDDEVIANPGRAVERVKRALAEQGRPV